MNPNEERLQRLEQKIDAMYQSVEKTRKYILVMLIGTVAMFLLPLILALFVLPFALSTFSSMYAI